MFSSEKEPLKSSTERNADMLWLSLAKTLHVTVPSVCTSGHPRIGPLEKCDLIMQDPKAKKALNDLSSSIGDEENPYLAAKAPMAGGPPTMGQRFWKELRQNWWLWGSVVFAILLVGGLLLFRNQLYDSATHGLPFLAVKENAAEACTTACQDEQSAGMALATGQGGDKDANNARLKEAFESCYTKCVAQETKDVAEERQKFKKTEEDFEKMVEGQVVQPGV